MANISEILGNYNPSVTVRIDRDQEVISNVVIAAWVCPNFPHT